MTNCKWFKFIGVLVVAASLSGCAYLQSTQTPEATASVGDTQTSATLKMGSIGEFTFVATHSKTATGDTTGTVSITGTKETLNNANTGMLGLLAGWILRGAGTP